MKQPPSRKLAVILHADVVGSTALVRRDETLAHQRIGECLRRLAATVAAYGGVACEVRGDALVADFARASDALCAAVAFQRENAHRAAAGDDELSPRLRVGVAMGEVVVADGTVTGEGVVLAQRLEQLADADGVCVQGATHDTTPRRLPLDFRDLGEQTLKGFDEPVRAYAVGLRAGAEPPPPEPRGIPLAAAAAPARPSIAVLPFTNISGDATQEYFSDGLTDDIITALSQWRSVAIIARNSSFAFKGRTLRVQTVAEELGARYVVEGSVRRAGARLRVNVQLVDAASGHQLWAQRFDRQLEDVFDVQDEIASRIAATVVPELESFENRRSAAKPTADLDAWDLYLRGMQTFYDETCAGTVAARRQFEAAVASDPDYADAWARLGWCHAREVMFGCTDDRRAALQAGFAAARRAVALDDASALAHMSLGTVHIWAEQTELGLAEAQRALELNPNFAIVAMAVGNRLDLVGRTEEGIVQMERSLQLNPRDPSRWRYLAYLSRARLSLGDFERAAELSREAMLLRPDLPEALFRHAVCLAHLDRVEEARDLLGRCAALDPGYVAGKAGWQPYPDARRSEQVLAGLRRHGLLP